MALIIVIGIAGFFAGQTTAPRIQQTVTVERTVVRTVTQQVTQQPMTQVQQQMQQIPDKIVVGFTVSLSGSQALAGRNVLWGIQAATKWINDVYGGIKIGNKRVKIELKYYDDQSSKDLVPSLYERLITVDKVDFLLGPYGSPLVYVAAPIAEKYGKLMVDAASATDALHLQGYRFIVRVWTPASLYLSSIIKMLNTIDPKARLAIIFTEDEFSKYVGNGAIDAAKSYGMSIVYYKSVSSDIKDFTPILTEMALSKPDVILIATAYDPVALLAIKQLVELNINAKLIGLTTVINVPEFYRNFGTLAEGIVGPGQFFFGLKYSPQVASRLGIEYFGPTSEEFEKLLREVSGIESPSYHTAAGAGILALAKAIEVAQSLDQDAVRRAFNQLDILMFYGRFKIDPTTGKQIGHEMFVTQWQGGKLKIIWPPEVATSKPVYPIPTWDEKRQGKQAIPQ